MMCFMNAVRHCAVKGNSAYAKINSSHANVCDSYSYTVDDEKINYKDLSEPRIRKHSQLLGKM